MSVSAAYVEGFTTAPRDKGGSYPSLIGFAPASLGKRFAARLIDSLICAFITNLIPFLIFGAEMYSELYQAGRTQAIAVSSWTVLGLAAVFSIVELVLIFILGTYLGGLIMGIRHVRVATGEIGRPSTFVKYLLAGILAVPSLGLIYLVIVLATRDRLTKRHVLDRLTEIIAIDIRNGRGPVDASHPVTRPDPAPHRAVTGIQNVGLGQPRPASSREENPLPPAAAQQDAVPDFAPPPSEGTGYHAGSQVAEVPFGNPFDATNEAEPSRIAQVSGPIQTAFIDSTPLSRATPARHSRTAPSIDKTPMVRHFERAAPRTAASVPALEVESTVVDPEAFAAIGPPSSLRLILDDQTPLSTTAITLLGRAPLQREFAGETVIVPVEDPKRQISKTHLAVGLDGEGGWWVMDLHSTNGTKIVDQNGAGDRIETGVRVQVPQGSHIRFGEHEIKAVS